MNYFSEACHFACSVKKVIIISGALKEPNTFIPHERNGVINSC